MYTLGLDYGTNSVRCLIARVSDGAEIAIGIAPYAHGDAGIVTDRRDPDVARQHPHDYLAGTVEAVRGALETARRLDPGFGPEQILALGVDTTASTPLPVGRDGRSLVETPGFADNADAMAWLWKDHTATREAAQLTAGAREQHPEFLAKCGGSYSSEWFWSKIWRCAVVAPDVAEAADTWIELADWIPAVLTGTGSAPARGICAAGHKGLYHDSWGGYPPAAFLGQLHPYLGRIREQLGNVRARGVNEAAGQLTDEWSSRLGLPRELRVAVGAIDAHLGAVGSGIGAGTLVKILGTSTCDMMVAPLEARLPDIPGICGIVPGSILPGFFGLEAGQSAVGDLFNWFVQRLAPAGATHESLSEEAARFQPGESGLLALDWNNGNRNVLCDQRLTGLLLGQTLATRPAEIYRALIEATAFGARMIMERFEEFGVRVERVVNCGGIAEKSPLVLQIYADVTNRPMQLARSTQTCALGAAVAAAVVGGAYPDISTAQRAMTGVKPTVYRPRPTAVRAYEQLFALYRTIHDAFGQGRDGGTLEAVMKQLLDLRDATRQGDPPAARP